MEILALWRHFRPEDLGHYMKDANFQFNSHDPAFRDDLSSGDCLWLVSIRAVPGGADCILSAKLTVERVMENPDEYRGGKKFRVQAQKQESEYFAPDGPSIVPLLSQLKSPQVLGLRWDTPISLSRSLRSPLRLNAADSGLLRDWAATLKPMPPSGVRN